jgi:hypothetical protein
MLKLVQRKYIVAEMQEVTLPAGSLLFHGTIEEFEGDLKGGGYDDLIWFADSPQIAQLYIPKSGGTTYVSDDSRALSRPTQDKDMQQLQKMIGIEYDYKDVEWGTDGRAKSFRAPKGWDAKALPTEADVAALMKKAGFEKNRHGSYEIHTHKGKVLSPKEKVAGRLFVAKVKSPLRIWKKARGEGDLTDVQYHDLKGFKAAADAGFDGVMIDDFAQSKEWGNLGHLSVGLFDTKKLSITSRPAGYHEYDNRERGTPEYPNPPAMFLHKL